MSAEKMAELIAEVVPNGRGPLANFRCTCGALDRAVGHDTKMAALKKVADAEDDLEAAETFAVHMAYILEWYRRELEAVRLHCRCKGRPR